MSRCPLDCWLYTQSWLASVQTSTSWHQPFLLLPPHLIIGQKGADLCWLHQVGFSSHPSSENELLSSPPSQTELGLPPGRSAKCEQPLCLPPAAQGWDNSAYIKASFYQNNKLFWDVLATLDLPLSVGQWIILFSKRIYTNVFLGYLSLTNSLSLTNREAIVLKKEVFVKNHIVVTPRPPLPPHPWLWNIWTAPYWKEWRVISEENIFIADFSFIYYSLATFIAIQNSNVGIFPVWKRKSPNRNKKESTFVFFQNFRPASTYCRIDHMPGCRTSWSWLAKPANTHSCSAFHLLHNS